MDERNWGMRASGILLLWAATAVALPAQTFTSLHSFDNMDGRFPEAGLVQATNGNLYGTTSEGGANSHGTVFKTTSSGTLTTLDSFCSQSNCTDGKNPNAGLVQGTDGNLYGTTYAGGTHHAGTVFKMTPAGVLTTLYNFCSLPHCTDGEGIVGGLIQGTEGGFYGMTYGGGVNGLGTVFKITPSGVLTTLHSFNTTEGIGSVAGLIQGADGNFYGTTLYGGANENNCISSQCGTVFKVTSRGALTTLYNFCSQSNCTDGAASLAGLVQGGDGAFYGTTSRGGASDSCEYGCGTVFKITPNGTLTTLHSFESTDGNYPSAGLVQGTDENFYGTTALGGANGGGTVFKVTPSGNLTVLHSFDVTDGSNPFAELAQDTSGAFYGTTQSGGAHGIGTVFGLSVGLGPFVETQPTSRMVGAAVKILGTNLTGATSVTFNGTAATFTVVAKSLITTTVPAGATTGTVQVVTPSGTLSSNVPLRVAP